MKSSVVLIPTFIAGMVIGTLLFGRDSRDSHGSPEHGLKTSQHDKPGTIIVTCPNGDVHYVYPEVQWSESDWEVSENPPGSWRISMIRGQKTMNYQGKE